MTSDKQSIALLSEIFVKKGLKHIVISPGSRNAPIIIAFANHPGIKALSVVDERSAAFFALGIAQQTKKTVAIACTSGSAVLNYAPAIAEAYYQKVPLLVLTADRPKEFIDIGDGQTIRQKNVYANYIKKSFELPEDINSGTSFNNAVKILNKAINLTLTPDFGPVHINLPFTEPIYNQVEKQDWNIKINDPYRNDTFLNKKELDRYSKTWNKSTKKLLIVGLMDQNPEILGILKKIINDNSVVLLSETTSNLNGNNFSYSGIDKIISTISEKDAHNFQPDLLVTFGGHIVSKMIKAFLRKNKPAEHWHIDPVEIKMDTYQSLTSGIQMKPETFLMQLISKLEESISDYSQLWEKRAMRSENRHDEFLANCEYSDLKVFETILNLIPEGSNLHLGNSTPVRYAQLFEQKKKLYYFSNRGTSGIDGTVSTAAGAAFVKTDKPTTIITGDLGFLYDSNALMNKHLTGNLRIIVINNNGGGIFRFIPGPGDTNQLEEFFETKHNWSAKHIARNFEVPYYSAFNLQELEVVLGSFYSSNNNKPAILEIFTPNEKNAAILKAYFNFLKD